MRRKICLAGKIFLFTAVLFWGCGCGNKIKETETQESTIDMTVEMESARETEISEPETSLPETSEEETSLPSETGESKEKETETPPPPATESVYMTLGEILAYNQRGKAAPATHLTDMGGCPDTLSGEQVRGMIESYSFPNYPLINGEPITDTYKAGVLARRYLEGIPEQVSVGFALTVKETAIRSFPTWDAIGNGGFDYFQESMFLTGECVAVLHGTADGVWSFVQGENYNGWVMSENLAMTDRGTWINWWNQTSAGENCVVFLANQPGYRMGTVLPLAGETGGAYQGIFPARDGAGNLVLQVRELPKNGEVYLKGYLPYNKENVMKQVHKMVGTPYGWGDSGGNPDCSSTVQAIYRCFGFRLARNSSWQAAMPGMTRSLEGKSREEIIGILAAKQPGTILCMNGHVMMYVGMEGGSPMIFHNVTTYSSNSEDQIGKMRGVITPLDIYKLDGTSYYEAIHSLLDLSEQ